MNANTNLLVVREDREKSNFVEEDSLVGGTRIVEEFVYVMQGLRCDVERF